VALEEVEQPLIYHRQGSQNNRLAHLQRGCFLRQTFFTVPLVCRFVSHKNGFEIPHPFMKPGYVAPVGLRVSAIFKVDLSYHLSLCLNIPFVKNVLDTCFPLCRLFPRCDPTTLAILLMVVTAKDWWSRSSGFASYLG
jgi:hypothetical protein